MNIKSTFFCIQIHRTAIACMKTEEIRNELLITELT